MKPLDRFHLPQDEERLLQYLDGQLPDAEARATEAHLAACAECQNLRHQWAELDEKLAHSLPQPRLSRDFLARLRQRVAAEDQAGARGARAQEGYGAGGLWLRVLDGLGYGVAAAVGGYWLYHLTVAWLAGSARTGAVLTLDPAFVGSLVVAGAALLVGLSLATRNKVLSWLKEL